MITKEEFKDRIVKLVEDCQGLKATELPAKFDLEMLGTLEVVDFPTVLAELLHERRIVEIEYTLPNMNYRVKSFILPAGTDVNVHIGAFSKSCMES